MIYTSEQSSQLANKIHATLAQQITVACAASPVLPGFLAGLIGVENSFLNPAARRYESHVFDALKNIRDEGKDKGRDNYNGIVQSRIADCTDAALRNLATSWGYTQIMGWWAIRMNWTVARLKDKNSHLSLAVQLIEKVAPKQVEKGDWQAALRIWNTGSAAGKAHDLDYVYNALVVMVGYNHILLNEGQQKNG